RAVRMRILGRMANELLAAPPCAGCGVEKADTGWVISPIGVVHGFCFRCAGGTRERSCEGRTTAVENSNLSDPRRKASSQAARAVGAGRITRYVPAMMVHRLNTV